MNKDKYEKVRQDFDEIIKMSINEELKEIDDMPIPTNEEMLAHGYTLPPEDMYEKILAACSAKKSEEPIKPVPYKKKKWKKIVLVAAVIAMLLGTLNANAVKVFIFKTINQITDSAIRIRGVNEADYELMEVDAEEAYQSAEKRIGKTIQRPYYLPEEMAFDSIAIVDDNRVKMDYGSADGKYIKVYATEYNADMDTGRVIDTDTGETSVDNIADREVLFAYYTRKTGEEWIIAIWEDSNIVYEINSNINKNDLIKVIEEFK